MTRRILAAINRALLVEPTPEREPHFHSGAEGQPAACYDVRCSSPRLDPNLWP